MWLSKLFQDSLVTQLLARNTSVGLSVTMLATKGLMITFQHTSSFDCSSGSQRMVASVVCEERSRRNRNQFASARASAEG